MGYRGDDLDLRTPMTWGSGTADPAASETVSPSNGQRGYRDDPIWVDDALLACCNHAFDVALAHRSAEVRLEHLLHALTRIETAAEALEARGVRVTALRRESATIIASEIPIGLSASKVAPHRSDEFADALRLAGAQAARRGDPAGVDDLLFVLLDQRPDLPGLALLARFAPRSLPQREAIDPMYRYVEPRHAQTIDRYYRLDPPRAARGHRPEVSGSTTDILQNSRIETLEQLVRALSADLAAEREAVATLLKDLNRTASAQRDDQDRMQADLFDRLQTFDQASRDGIAARLQSLEDAVRGSGGGSGGGGYERLLEAVDFSPLSRRLEAIEEALLGRGSNGGDEGDMPRAPIGAEIAERLAAIEEALKSETGTTAAKYQAYTEEVHDALMRLNQNQHTLAGAIDQWRTEGNSDIAMISNRLAGIDRNNEMPFETLNALSAHLDMMNRMFIERYHRRNRFWYWLFGTDDWLGRSWPSQSAAIEAEAQAMKVSETA